MRITFVIPFASLVGGNRVVVAYALRLRARGHEVKVISQSARPPDGMAKRILKNLLGKPVRYPKIVSPLFQELGDDHIVLNMNHPGVAADVPSADAVIATWWRTAEWVADLPSDKGRKFYLLQDYELFDNLPVKRVAATYTLPLRKLAVSGYISRMLAERHSIPDVPVLPNGVDIVQFTAPPRGRNDPLRVGFLYTRKSRKRIGLAIDALAQARALVPNLQVVSFGTVRPGGELTLPDWITYHHLPAQDEIPRIYASCDLWLFTSEKEGFGLPILEAMACRTPVLATRAGAAEDLVTGRNGWLTDSGSNRIVDRICTVAAMSDSEWRAVSEAAYCTARAHGWDEAVTRLLAELCYDAAVSAP